jgi:hypothetical protein
MLRVGGHARRHSAGSSFGYAENRSCFIACALRPNVLVISTYVQNIRPQGGLLQGRSLYLLIEDQLHDIRRVERYDHRRALPVARGGGG